MLGRTANGLFWMFRLLERAENTARLLDTGLRMALTRDLVAAEEEWRSVIQTLGQAQSYEAKNESYTGIQAWNHVLRERDNPSSVMEMFTQVRQNARLARNAISGEVWEAINVGWMELKEALKRPVQPGSVGEVVNMVRRAGTLVHGAMEGSMLRDEGYHFAQVGTFMERGDSIARILDVKYYLLLPSLSYVGSSLDTGQWDQVLRSVGGDRAFRGLYGGAVDARGIVAFLLLDDRFPRSLAFCHSELRDHLAQLARIHGQERASNSLMREYDMRLHEMTIDRVFDQGLHEFLLSFINDNNRLGNAIADDYRFFA